eukprot:gene19132-24971_t
MRQLPHLNFCTVIRRLIGSGGSTSQVIQESPPPSTSNPVINPLVGATIDEKRAAVYLPGDSNKDTVDKDRGLHTALTKEAIDRS